VFVLGAALGFIAGMLYSDYDWLVLLQQLDAHLAQPL